MRGGGPKLGVKKMTKEQKLCVARGKMQYSLDKAPCIAQHIGILDSPAFFETQINTMTMEKIIPLNEDIQDITRSEVDGVAKVIMPHFIPVVRQWQAELERAKNMIGTLEDMIAGTKDAVSLSFVNEFFAGSQMNYDKFYTMVSNRLDDLNAEADRERMRARAEEAANAQVEALVVARLAAMNGSADVDMRG